MNIAFIQPSVGKIIGQKYPRSWCMYPLNLGVISGLTPKEHCVNFIDDRFNEIDYNSKFDLVAMPVETYTAKRAYFISNEFRSRGTKVILGGIHTTLVPKEAKQYADSIIIGDAENTWLRLLSDIKSDNLRAAYYEKPQEFTLNNDKTDRTIFKKNNYLPISLIETGRGCGFKCDFCAVSASQKQTYRTKCIEKIISEIEECGQKNVYFVDDNFVSNFNRTKELCDKISSLNIRWISQGSINMAYDEELLIKMQKSGCFNMLIGFESLNEETLNKMGKGWASFRKKYDESIKIIRDNGITIYATFVFGYDNDTKDDFKRTLDFAIDQNFAISAFNHLVPFPGTPVYKRLEKEKRLIYDKWWLREGGKFGEVVFHPKNMTSEELAENCYKCRESFYRYGSITKRLFDFKANSKNLTSLAYMAYVNLFSKNEAKKRQGWPIGEII